MGTHPLAGRYHNRTIFAAGALERLAATLDQKKPAKLLLTNVIGAGDDEWSVQKLRSTGIFKNGKLQVPSSRR